MTDSTPKLSTEERAAMKEYLADQKAQAKRAKSANEAAENLADVLDKIAKMAPADRKIAEAIHQLIVRIAPEIAPKTWYGMQAYFLNGKVVAFFQDGGKFKSRYSTLGFQQDAALDDGDMWPTSFAVLEYNAAVEKRITELVLKAVGR